MDRGAWEAAAHGVAESDTAEQLHFPFTFSCLKNWDKGIVSGSEWGVGTSRAQTSESTLCPSVSAFIYHALDFHPHVTCLPPL